MNTRSIGVLALVTGATVLAAFLFTQRRESATAATTSEETLFPSLGDKINDAARVALVSNEGSFTVAREDDGEWGLVEKAGYPVDQSKVRKLLIALQGAKVVEAKTSRPELYSKLGVEDATAEESTSVEVTVADASGTALASLVVGNQGQNRSRPAYYVRRKDEAPSYLVEADLAIDKSDKTWLDKEIVDVARERVKAIEIQHAGGERVFVHKADEDGTEFTLEDMPEGKELRYAGAPGSLASGLARLTMDDVRAADEVSLPEETTAVTTFWTYDGLKLTAKLYEVEEELLATFAAEYDAAGPALPSVEPEAGEDAAADDPSDEEAPEEDTGPTPEEVQQQAADLVAKTSPWVYVLPSWKKSTLAKTLEEMTKDIPPPPEPEPELEPEVLDAPAETEGAATSDEPPAAGEAEAADHDHDHADGDHSHGDEAAGGADSEDGEGS